MSCSPNFSYQTEAVNGFHYALCYCTIHTITDLFHIPHTNTETTPEGISCYLEQLRCFFFFYSFVSHKDVTSLSISTELLLNKKLSSNSDQSSCTALSHRGRSQTDEGSDDP